MEWSDKVTDLQDNILKEHYNYLSLEQQQAVKSLSDEQQLNVLIGRTGTGKTTTLKAVVDVHKQSGYKTLGLALSAVAAENLALETNCSAETVPSILINGIDERKLTINFGQCIRVQNMHALREI